MQVRNSAGGIMQLFYREDKLDPVVMEDAGGKPINLPLQHIDCHFTD